jgi:hypothetical protein
VAPVTIGGIRVRRVSNEESAARRAQWLAELTDALDAARHLVADLELGDGRIDAADLYARIEAVRIEVLAMRLWRSGAGGQDFGPEWSEGVPWQRSA